MIFSKTFMESLSFNFVRDS